MTDYHILCPKQHVNVEQRQCSLIRLMKAEYERGKKDGYAAGVQAERERWRNVCLALYDATKLWLPRIPGVSIINQKTADALQSIHDIAAAICAGGDSDDLDVDHSWENFIQNGG